MNILYPAGTKREWVDRNPLITTQYYTVVGLGPHTLTNRGQYTVPTGRRAFVDNIFLYLHRNNVATTADVAYAGAVTYDNFQIVDIARAAQNQNVRGVVTTYNLNIALYLSAMQYVRMYTLDNSTGGSYDYYISLHIVEFDV
jgi:hypothetical protein